MSAPPPVWERALAAPGHVVLEASAGTGKTFTLEQLVVSAVASGTPLERILVVTFTEKAARELRERVRARIAERVRELQAAGRTPSGGEGAGGALGYLNQALLNFDQATIATIHGFCQRVLTRHAFAGGRMLDQALADGAAVFRQVALQVLREVLAEDGAVAGWVEAALAEDSLDALVAQLRDCHVQRGTLAPGPRNPGPALAACAAIDPQAAAAAVEALLPVNRGLGKVLVDGAQRLAAAGRADDLFEALGWLAEAEKKAYKPRGAPVDDKTPVPELAGIVLTPHRRSHPALGPLLDAIGALGEARTNRLALIAHALLDRVRERLAAHKARRGLFDFDDLIQLVRDGLQASEAGPALRASLRAEYRLALIDEFQDTDAAQWDIFRTLFFDGDEGHKLVVVGDPKQAIYGFRGADVHTYLQARERIRASGGEVLQLDTCYRATPEVVAGFNALFESDFFSAGSGLDYSPVACGRTERRLLEAGVPAPGVVAVRLEDGTPGSAGLGGFRRAWLDFVIHEILRLTGPEGPRLLDGQGPDARSVTRDPDGRVTAGDIQVLVRSAKDARAVARALRRHRIPHAFYRQPGLLASPEAQDVAALLAALARPDDPAARLAAWLTGFFGLEVSELGAAGALPPGHPLIERLERWRTWAETHHWERLFDDALHAAGLTRRLLFSEAEERSLTNYLHLFDLLLAEVHAAPLTPAELAARVAGWVAGRRTPGGSQNPDMQRLDTDRAAVQILTMHAAKGLEAPVVFPVGAWSRGGRAPAVQVFHREGERIVWAGPAWGEAVDAIEAEQAQEDERLMYVALTRAAGRLYLPLPPPGTPRFNGGYSRLAQRLQTLVDAGEGARPAWLGVERWSFGEEAPADVSTVPALDGLTIPAPEAELPDLEGPRRQAAPVLVTSYSRMKSGFERHRVAEGAEARALRDEAEEGHAPVLQAEGLPGGKGVGIFLHEVLEQVDYEAARAAPDGDAWRTDPAVHGLLQRLGTRHGIDPTLLPEAARLVWGALATPLTGPDLVLPRGLREVGRRIPEMPFVYPIPEAAHPLLERGAAPQGAQPFQVRRGFIQGVVDLVFEHEGRFWLLDWKSDRLPDYSAAAVQAHIQAAYRDQARIYSLAVLRALGLHTPAAHRERFGGVVYLFLRGLDGEGRGLWVHRPSWPELCDWERWLLQKDAGGWGVSPERVLQS